MSRAAAAGSRASGISTCTLNLHMNGVLFHNLTHCHYVHALYVHKHTHVLM